MEVEYGTLFRVVRKELGWSQAQFGRVLGVSQGMISLIERNIQRPDGDLLRMFLRLVMRRGTEQSKAKADDLMWGGLVN